MGATKAARKATATGKRPTSTSRVRQAVVVIHGMGEQLPLDTLNGFIGAALPLGGAGPDDVFSRPDRATQSFEARRYLARRRMSYRDPEQELYAQTEFFEYHWSHLMTGNRIGHLWPTLRHMLFTPVTKVPSGLRVLWVVVWAAVLAAVGLMVTGTITLPQAAPGADDLATRIVSAILGGGLVLSLATALIALVQRSITTSFVDVVRYLDTSPASFSVRQDIRKGIVDLLRNLHDREGHHGPKYQRIIVVAHSLGAYIAYDAITRLWWEITSDHAAAAMSSEAVADEVPDGLAELQKLAARIGEVGSDDEVAAYQAAQRRLWLGLRAQGNPWRITDFISVGTPMYMADLLAYRDRATFDSRVRKTEIATCPPQPDRPPHAVTLPEELTGSQFSWRTRGMHWRVLHHAAPFAVVRWTNMWYPAKWGFFGDWFGGPLQPLFGPGIRDIEIERDGWKRWLPGAAHSMYFPNARVRDTSRSAGAFLREALALDSTDWLAATADQPLVTLLGED